MVSYIERRPAVRQPPHLPSRAEPATAWRLKSDLAQVRTNAVVRSAQDHVEAALAKDRIRNAVRLANSAAMGISNLSRLIGTVAAGSPELEMELRLIEEVVVLGARNIIYDYMQGE